MVQKINSKQNGGFWEELGRHTLTVAGDSLTVSSLPLKKYNRVLLKIVASGTISAGLIFNNDTGASYSFRYRADNAEGGATSQTVIASLGNGNLDGSIEFSNNSTMGKQVASNTFSGTSAATNPGYTLIWAYWGNTAAITRVDIVNLAAGDFAAGSEIVILGHD